MTKSDMRKRLTFGSMAGLGRVERTDGDVVSVKISERKLGGSSAGIHVWLFFQPADEQCARLTKLRHSCRSGRTRGGRFQAWRSGGLSTTDARGHPTCGDRAIRSIRVEDLAEIVVRRSRLRQP